MDTELKMALHSEMKCHGISKSDNFSIGRGYNVCRQMLKVGMKKKGREQIMRHFE